jgi:hypothetical protein
MIRRWVMDQMIFEGIGMVSFFILGTIGLLIAGEIICRVYEIAAPAIKTKLYGLISSTHSRRRQRSSLNCSYHALPVRFRG